MVPWNEDCNICIGFGYQQYLAILISLIHADDDWQCTVCTLFLPYMTTILKSYFFSSVWFFSSTFTNVTLWLQSLGVIVLWYILTCRNCCLCRHWFSVSGQFFSLLWILRMNITSRREKWSNLIPLCVIFNLSTAHFKKKR